MNIISFYCEQLVPLYLLPSSAIDFLYKRISFISVPVCKRRKNLQAVLNVNRLINPFFFNFYGTDKVY